MASFSIQFGAIVFDDHALSNWDFWLLTDGSGGVTGFQLLASFGTPFADPGNR